MSSFQAARKAHPPEPARFGANIEALLGVAALRRGESDNCIACCTDASCIFPLAAAAVHQQTDGSRQAIRHFTAYLEKRPEDIGVRWLLNIAYMTLGEYPEKVPAQYLIPLDRFQLDDRRRPVLPTSPRRSGSTRWARIMPAAASSTTSMATAGSMSSRPTSTRSEGRASSSTAAMGGSRNGRDRPAWPTRSGRPTPPTPTTTTTATSMSCCCAAGGSGRSGPRCCATGATAPSMTSPAAAGLITPIACHSGAWADYDNDGFVDLYMAGEFDRKRPDPRNLAGSTTTTATARSPTSPPRPGCSTSSGARGRPGATTTTTAIPTFTSRITPNRTGSTATTATARSPTWPRRWASPSRSPASRVGGGTTTTMVGSTCSSAPSATGSPTSSVATSASRPSASGPASSAMRGPAASATSRRRPASTACSSAWGRTSATSITTDISTCISGPAGPSIATSSPTSCSRTWTGSGLRT